MDDLFVVTCPYCGEELEIYVEPDDAAAASSRTARSAATRGWCTCRTKTASARCTSDELMGRRGTAYSQG